ncbi:MAG: putative toxin-antitoxin system toxin component, PIN family [Planctomycetia bacterium]|nr:putative toxin-antitoxin system toxin component, PIN family [Planctomycetia bacterium]
MTARAVFDSMVFLQAAASPEGPARRCLRLVDQGEVALFVSNEILDEVRDVLTRLKTRRRFPLLTFEKAVAFLENVKDKAVAFSQVPRVVSLPRDPKDEPYLNLAVAAGAQFLVTRDRDLLDLMQDQTFRAAHPGLSIVDPVAFLQSIE